MKGQRFTTFIVCIFMLLAACRKDEDIKAVAEKTPVQTTVTKLSPGSFLATSGKLKININDTTYIFDAATDSIAFIKVDTAGSQYFGVTAINKAHNVSFGISGLGETTDKVNAKVAGSQLLLNLKNTTPLAYVLMDQNDKLEPGKLNLKKYSNRKTKITAKGTFTTFLINHAKSDNSLNKVDGSFDLQMKQ